MLDEWISKPEEVNSTNNDMGGMDHSNMSSMDHSNMNNDTNTNNQNNMHGNSTMEHDMSMYDLFTINGKSGDSLKH